jgi:hypothetical protein
MQIKNINGASRLGKFWKLFVWRHPNYFLSRLVTLVETWLYHCEWRQSNSQWSGDIVAHPFPASKNSECKIRWKISELEFLG